MTHMAMLRIETLNNLYYIPYKGDYSNRSDFL